MQAPALLVTPAPSVLQRGLPESSTSSSVALGGTPVQAGLEEEEEDDDNNNDDDDDDDDGLSIPSLDVTSVSQEDLTPLPTQSNQHSRRSTSSRRKRQQSTLFEDDSTTAATTTSTEADIPRNPKRFKSPSRGLSMAEAMVQVAKVNAEQVEQKTREKARIADRDHQLRTQEMECRTEERRLHHEKEMKMLELQLAAIQAGNRVIYPDHRANSMDV